MHESFSGVRRSPSPAVVSQRAGGAGYRSADGEFNYYPTSVHKRQQLGETQADASKTILQVAQIGRVENSPSISVENRIATSPSSAGLSRSPSQRSAPAKPAVVPYRSVSQPLSSTMSRPELRIHVLPAAEGFKSGAPLLHRYRTSQARFLRRASPRSASSPTRAPQLPSSAVKGETAKQRTGYARRSLLPKPTAALSSDVGSSPSLLEESTAARASPASNSLTRADAAAIQEQARPPTYNQPSFQPKRATASGTRVPVMRVRLMEHGQSASDTESTHVNKEGVSATARAETHTLQDPLQRSECRETSQLTDASAVTQGTSFEKTTTSSTIKASPGARRLNVLLSKEVTPTSFCSDGRCMHSEQSIGEFILMQRELRRCYMALDDYEVVVAQLRQECTEAWAAHHQLQRQWVQREAELTVQINAARGSERDAEVRKTENGDDRHLAESNCSVEDTDVKACLQTTWRETVDALRRAFHEEKATHTATRRELDAALVAEKRWRTRAAELHRWRNRVCRQLDDSSLVSADTSEKHAAATGVGSTQVSPSHSPFFPGPGNQHPECVHASNGSSPAPRFHSPPHPHQAPSRPHADTAESAYNMADASVLSALTNASAAKDSNGKAAEKSVVNTTTGTVDRSSASSTDASGLSQDDCAGDATAAVGSGRVRVETPEFEPQEEPAEDLIIQMPSQPQLSRSPLHTGPAPHAVTEAARRTQEAGADNEINPSCIASPPTDAGCINDPALAPEGRELAAPLEKATQATKQAQHQEQQRRQLAFPPPTFAMTTDVPGSHKSVCMPWSAKDTSDASRSAVVLAERKCKELLGALLDKERQLALIAEERTKYKRLYVEQTAKQPT